MAKSLIIQSSDSNMLIHLYIKGVFKYSNSGKFDKEAYQ